MTTRQVTHLFSIAALLLALSSLTSNASAPLVPVYHCVLAEAETAGIGGSGDLVVQSGQDAGNELSMKDFADDNENDGLSADIFTFYGTQTPQQPYQHLLEANIYYLNVEDEQQGKIAHVVASAIGEVGQKTISVQQVVQRDGAPLHVSLTCSLRSDI